jgi:hypothetical protein|tara:strand:- start:519 stop:755 length:237 start_codon:yes stop_codon:yes gene_type:complete
MTPSDYYLKVLIVVRPIPDQIVWIQKTCLETDAVDPEFGDDPDEICCRPTYPWIRLPGPQLAEESVKRIAINANTHLM